MEYTYKKVEVDEESLNIALEILKTSFPDSKKFSIDYLRWQYAENPIGNIVGFNAFYEDALAAHYVAMPISMTLFGKERKGLLSLNTATHPDHRGKRLFSILADKTYKYAAENGFDYVIGVANANSTHGFLKNLGFYLISPLEVKFGLGCKVYSDKKNNCYRNWSNDLLNWRLKNPSNKYSFKNNILFSPIAPVGVKGLLGKVDFEMDLKTKNRFRPINLYVGLGANLSKGLYFKIPSFIKHSPFNLIFKDLTGNLPEIKKEDVFFQLLDFDVA